MQDLLEENLVKVRVVQIHLLSKEEFIPELVIQELSLTMNF